MKASFWDRNQYKLAPVFFLLPALILFSIYVIYPIISSLWISLYEWDGIGEKTAVSLMKKFKSVKNIKSKSLYDLKIAIGDKKGTIIFNYYSTNRRIWPSIAQ